MAAPPTVVLQEPTVTIARPDREDLSAQEEALAAARSGLREAVEDLERVSRAEAGGGRDERMAAVAAEARDLSRVLRSRARRPPAVDTVALAGAVSAAERAAARSDAWDEAVRGVRDAEAHLDAAALDLESARGEDV